METTAYRPSRESRAFDSDRSASHQPTASYIRARAARLDLSQDDPVPLFLSDPLRAPDPREYTSRALRPRTRRVPGILAAVLAASAATILTGLFQSDLRNLVVAYAGGWAVQTAASQPPAARQAPIEGPARTTDTVLASADVQSLPAPPAPSREAIATAYQTALQAQAPLPAPAPVAAQPSLPPPEPVRILDADTLAGLMTRARSLIGVGDIASARLLLERAANARDATAALLLAQTYDPAVLGTSDARTIIADVSVARDWYQRAASLGSAEARQHLSQLAN